jgi:hypothetical protein
VQQWWTASKPAAPYVRCVFRSVIGPSFGKISATGSSPWRIISLQNSRDLRIQPLPWRIIGATFEVIFLFLMPAAPAASADTTDKCKTATCDNPAEKKKNYGFCAACS